MKFFEVATNYFINLEDISIFHIYMMDEKDYKNYNRNKLSEDNNLQFILHVVYKSSNDEGGVYYPLTTHQANRFMEMINFYVV